MDKTVSIILPTHNRVGLLSRAIDSLRRQTFSNIEIIVVSDASTDGTEHYMSNAITNDERIKFYKHSIPKGAPAARNLGLSKASGKYVTFLDDDDEMLPTKIEKMLETISKDVSMVATGYYVQKIESKDRILPNRKITLNDLLYYYPLGGGNQMMTLKERALSIGGFDESLSSFQDYDFWLRIVKKFGDGFCIQEALSIIHMEHEMGRISTSSKRFYGAFSFYNKHKLIMNKNQRRYQLLHLMILRKRKISLKQFFGMVPLRFWKSRYRYLLLCYLPFLSQNKVKLEKE